MMDKLAVAQYGLAPALASALLHSLWQIAVLALAAALALRAMAQTTASWRHTVAMAFLGAMALVPTVQFLRFWQDSGAPISQGLFPAIVLPPFISAANIFAPDSSTLATVVVALWLSGVGLMLARYLVGLRIIAAMERGPFRALPTPWPRRIDELRKAIGLVRTVAIYVSTDVATPCTARLLRPVIWLPLSLLTRAPADQIEALLAHELAHIARKDWLWSGVQSIIESLLFFHPAVWWLGRRIREEREHACDDLAVAAGGDAVALAEALAGLERDKRSLSGLALAAGGGPLLQRVTRLLTGAPSPGRWGAWALVAASMASGILLITQLGMAAGRLPDLEVRASTAGVLGPGDYRDITASGPSGRRFYRESLDGYGRRTERYEEAGRVRPIDAGVRRWVAEVQQVHVTGSQSQPGQPVMRHAEEQRALVEEIATHPDVVAKLGAPVVATNELVSGTIRFDDDAGGEADIRIALQGPRGRAVVAIRADMTGRAWTLRKVKFR